MKWSMLSVAALSVLFVNLHAQQSDQAPKPGASAHSTKVLTGCLQAGAAAESYTLKNATPRVDPQDLAGPPVGTAGEKAEYEVVAENGLERSGPPVDLKPHIGQQVELTVRPAEATAPPPAKSNTTQTSAELKPVERKPARVTVTAVKSLSPSCS